MSSINSLKALLVIMMRILRDHSQTNGSPVFRGFVPKPSLFSLQFSAQSADTGISVDCLYTQRTYIKQKVSPLQFVPQVLWLSSANPDLL